MQSNQKLPYLYDVAREPPPYPAILKPYCQPGYRQSYSGSETSTDVSLSSTENLSISARQEPQGEENFQRSFYPIETGVQDSCHSILSRLGMQDAVEVKTTQQGTFYITGNMPRSPTSLSAQYQSEASPKSQSCYLQCNYGAMSHEQRSPQNTSNYSSPRDSCYQDPQMVSALQHQRAPPQYPGTPQLQYTMNEKKELRRSYETLDKLQLTRSQPDLTQLMKYSSQPFQSQLVNYKQNNACNTQLLPRHSPNLPKKFTAVHELDLDHAAIANRATQLVEMLTEENKSMREELDNLYHKVSKLQKLEAEIQKIHDAHESLVRHANKREKLEAAMRMKLEQEIMKLHEQNRNLKNQLQKSSQNTCKDTDSSGISESRLTKDLENKEATIAKLLDKNKELTANRERLDIELAAQRSTLQEQRTHIEVLDKAFTNAQSNVVRLEEQLCKKQEQTEKIEQLQKALSSVQSASAKREILEQKLRSKLEEEIWLLKTKQNQQQQCSGGKVVDHDEGIASETDAPTSVQALLQQLHEKEQHILQLEAQVLQWEQKYLQESALRQFVIDAETMPQMARIAALEQSSLETEKIITEVRAERLNQLEEVYHAKRKCADMETSINSMKAKLAEKDAMIKVLQKHSPLTHSGSLSSLLCPSPLHSRKTSNSSQLSAESSHHGSTLDISMFKSSVHNRSSSAGSSGVSSIGGKESQLREVQQKCNVQNTLLQNEEEEDDQLSGRLWQV